MKKYISFILLSVLAVTAFAQQDAASSQFVLNMLTVNPAYAGYKEQPVMMLHHRSQWVGFKGAPITSIISFDTPLSKDQMAVGGSLVFDKIGPTTQMTFQSDFSYRFQMSRRSYLSFGLKGGFDFYQVNLTDLDLISDYQGSQDDFFQQNPKGLLLPNVGFGALYYDRNTFFGVSIPRILRNQLDKKGSDAWMIMEGSQQPTAYLVGGKLWKINRDYDFQPTISVKATQNAPVSVGVYANLYYRKALRLGVFYHYNEIAGAIVQYEYNRRWKFGYSVDVAASRLITTNLGSHELLVSYVLTNKRRRVVYPRYF
ncbi:MAG: type IX secretion system membrane protein PorP/SprF [Flavobacteriales bacterium]|nr:type IX secretion system membrane protein PorP/SprF [Flavobacteriales bacterium]